MKFLQFYMWWDCNNHCEFCFAKILKKVPTDNARRLQITQNAINILENRKDEQFDVIGLIGGEFFENQIADPDVNKKYIELIHKCIDMVENKKANMIYIMTHLIYQDTKYLDQVLDVFRERNALDKVMICTSYDPWGRFHTEARKKIWYDNVEKLLAENVLVHVEIVVSEYFLEALFAGEVDLQYFKDRGIVLDFLNPQGLYEPDGIIADNKERTMEHLTEKWLPTRESFIKFLFFLKKFNPVQVDRLFSLEIRAQELHIMSNDYIRTRDIETYNENIGFDNIMECGHSNKFAFYSNSDKCMICDINNFRKEFM